MVHTNKVNYSNIRFCMVLWCHAIEPFHVIISHIKRKPVFGAYDQVRLKPACSSTETSESPGILDLASIGTADAQSDLRLCYSHMA